MDVYFFKEGYLRTASESFDLDLQKNENIFVHLTNNAIQKYSDNYGKVEYGNMIMFDDFEKSIADKCNFR